MSPDPFPLVGGVWERDYTPPLAPYRNVYVRVLRNSKPVTFRNPHPPPPTPHPPTRACVWQAIRNKNDPVSLLHAHARRLLYELRILRAMQPPASCFNTTSAFWYCLNSIIFSRIYITWIAPARQQCTILLVVSVVCIIQRCSSPHRPTFLQRAPPPLSPNAACGPSTER